MPGGAHTPLPGRASLQAVRGEQGNIGAMDESWRHACMELGIQPDGDGNPALPGAPANLCWIQSLLFPLSYDATR